MEITSFTLNNFAPEKFFGVAKFVTMNTPQKFQECRFRLHYESVLWRTQKKVNLFVLSSACWVRVKAPRKSGRQDTPVFDLHKVTDQTVCGTALDKIPLSVQKLFWIHVPMFLWKMKIKLILETETCPTGVKRRLETSYCKMVERSVARHLKKLKKNWRPKIKFQVCKIH